MGTPPDVIKLKELLYRAETERLQLQHVADALHKEKQQATADMQQLKQQLEDAHSAFAGVQQEKLLLKASNDRLQLHVDAATREYRANDIICCHLRDQISKLQHTLNETQQTCKQQASQIGTFADDMTTLRQCKAQLTQQLSSIQEQHQQLVADHASTMQQLQEVHLELQDSKQRWLQEHGDIAAHMQMMLDEKHQQEVDNAQLAMQLSETQGLLQQQQAKVSELFSEVCSVRELVMVLGKAIGKQPRGQELPGHEDPVWLLLGPLGGVQYALEVVMKHIRSQDKQLKECKAEVACLRDRVRSESAQRMEVQAGLFEVRGLYAKAIADRESLESRAARAEAERAAAENNWQRAKAQADEDSTRLSELQASIMSLAKQVQQLLPLQPRCSTLEVERDTAQHKLDRLQEQHDHLQRQLQQAVAREAELRTGLDTYKQEHGQLLTANAQLVDQCQSLNKRVQVLEISKREGNLAVGQLEEARKRLNTTQTQLDVMSDSHARTLSKLETAKMLLGGLSTSQETSPAGGSGAASGAGSPRAAGGASRSSSLRSPTSRNLSSRPSRSHLSGSGAAEDAPALAATGALQSSRSTACTSPEPLDAQQSTGAAAAGSRASSAASRHRLSPCPGDGNPAAVAGAQVAAAAEPDGFNLADDLSSLPPEVAAMLTAKGLDQQLTNKQKKWHEIKVSMLSYFCGQLRARLVREAERSAHLENDLLQQEMDLLHLLQQREMSVSNQCMSVAEEARAVVQHVLLQLQQAMYEGNEAADGNTAASPGLSPDDVSTPVSWLPAAVNSMITNLKAVAAGAAARAQLIAARKEVAVQSDEPLQAEWLRFVRDLPQAAVTHTLHDKAVAEAIVRIYLRALHQQEAIWVAQRQYRDSQGLISHSPGGNSGTLFDVMMTHYSPQMVQQQQQSAMLLTYDASLWKDPQGPISRLLVSCQAQASSSAKVALFCCFSGTHTAAYSWGQQHWHHLLLLLHAVKRLVAGSWKAVLRDWSSIKGAKIPLQCVHDLLGNVYNCNVGQLTQLPAVMNSKQLLLGLLSSSNNAHTSADTAADTAADMAAAAAAAGPPGSAGTTAGGSRSHSNSAAEGNSSSSRRVVPDHGSVSAALEVLVEDSPSGLSVDLDDLLGMLMLQYDAGLLPLHPLMEPRRLTDGSLANTGNAWGTAAAEAAGGGGPPGSGRHRLGSPSFLGSGIGIIASESSEGGRSDWNYLLSSSGGSRPTTTGAQSRVATASGLGDPSSPPGSSAGVLPRIRGPESYPFTAHSSGSITGSLPPVVTAGSDELASRSALLNRANSRVAFSLPQGC